MSESSGSGEDRREYARIEIHAPVRIRPLTADEAEVLGHELAEQPSYRETLGTVGPPDPASQEVPDWERLALRTLLERLDALEGMVTRIAEELNVNVSGGGVWIHGETVNLSGAGAGLRVPSPLPVGTPVEVLLTLPGRRMGHVRLGAEIACHVRADGERVPVGQHHLGIKFVSIHKNDRESIIHYTFVRQRQQIRALRRVTPQNPSDDS